jgi:hypothetical protein
MSVEAGNLPRRLVAKIIQDHQGTTRDDRRQHDRQVGENHAWF